LPQHLGPLLSGTFSFADFPGLGYRPPRTYVPQEVSALWWMPLGALLASLTPPLPEYTPAISLVAHRSRFFGMGLG